MVLFWNTWGNIWNQEEFQNKTILKWRRYQTYSPNIDSSEKWKLLPEDVILITRRDGTTFTIDKQLSYEMVQV